MRASVTYARPSASDRLAFSSCTSCVTHPPVDIPHASCADARYMRERGESSDATHPGTPSRVGNFFQLRPIVIVTIFHHGGKENRTAAGFPALKPSKYA